MKVGRVDGILDAMRIPSASIKGKTDAQIHTSLPSSPRPLQTALLVRIGVLAEPARQLMPPAAPDLAQRGAFAEPLRLGDDRL